MCNMLCTINKALGFALTVSTAVLNSVAQMQLCFWLWSRLPKSSIPAQKARFLRVRRSVLLSVLFLVAQAAATAQSPDTSAHDGGPADAVLRARNFLESPTVRQTVLQALHPLATDREQTCGREARLDAGQGFTLTCEFQWQYESESVVSDTVTFQFDPVGELSSVGEPSTTGKETPFALANSILGSLKDTAVDKLIDWLFRENDKSSQDKMKKWIAKKIAEAATPQPRAKIVLGLILEFEQTGDGRNGGVTDSAKPTIQQPSPETQLRQMEIDRQRQIAQLIATAQGNCSQGNFTAAIDSYNRVIGMDQGNQAARSGLAVAQVGQQRQDELIQQQAATGEWADRGTHLMWTTSDNGQDATWKKANEYCQSLRTGGNADWRLPSIGELQGLYDPASSKNTVPLSHTSTILYLTRNSEVEQKGSYWTYHIKSAITLSGPGVWSGSSRDGYNDERWWLFFAKGTENWNETGEKMEMRALCVRPYVPPTDSACNSESAQTTQDTQRIEQVAVIQTPPVAADPAALSLAKSYVRQCEAVLTSATVDSQTGKLVLPPGCAEAYQKYLELAPDGPSAEAAKDILGMAGVPVKSH